MQPDCSLVTMPLLPRLDRVTRADKVRASHGLLCRRLSCRLTLRSVSQCLLFRVPACCEASEVPIDGDGYWRVYVRRSRKLLQVRLVIYEVDAHMPKRCTQCVTVATSPNVNLFDVDAVRRHLVAFQCNVFAGRKLASKTRRTVNTFMVTLV